MLVLRSNDAAARQQASNRGIGVVSTLSEAITVIERLHTVLPQKRGRLLRLSEWFTPAAKMQTLPANPRAIRPVPPYDPRR
jgi:phosphoenolpyruvate carboxylase